MLKIQRILVPLDYSDVSRAALNMALQLASQHKAEVYALHVMKDLDRELKRRLVRAPNESVIEDGIVEDEQAIFDAVEAEYDRIKDAGITIDRVPLHVIISGGEWLDVALSLVQSEELDLVVAGTHGPQGLKGFLLGSVTEKLVSKATCSVFVVKPPGYPYLRD